MDTDVTTDQVTMLMAHSLSPVSGESVVFRVAQQLLDHLTSGAVAPGTRLPSERQLAASLNVGRSAVREALAALDVLGIVSIRPGSGTYLTEATSEILPKAINWGLMLGQPRIHDLVELRQLLEVDSARLAAERADIADIERIAEQLELMEQEVDDAEKFAQHDVAFHLEVARAARNSVLNDVLSSVQSLLFVWVQRAIIGGDALADTLSGHRAVFEAIRRHDVAGAESAMRDHMAAAGERLRQSLG